MCAVIVVTITCCFILKVTIYFHTRHTFYIFTVLMSISYTKQIKFVRYKFLCVLFDFASVMFEFVFQRYIVLFP
jgi:hypothetical protein